MRRKKKGRRGEFVGWKAKALLDRSVENEVEMMREKRGRKKLTS
jgi:hypothetical protein